MANDPRSNSYIRIVRPAGQDLVPFQSVNALSVGASSHAQAAPTASRIELASLARPYVNPRSQQGVPPPSGFDHYGRSDARTTVDAIARFLNGETLNGQPMGGGFLFDEAVPEPWDPEVEHDKELAGMTPEEKKINDEIEREFRDQGYSRCAEKSGRFAGKVPFWIPSAIYAKNKDGFLVGIGSEEFLRDFSKEEREGILDKAKAARAAAKREVDDWAARIARKACTNKTYCIPYGAWYCDVAPGSGVDDFVEVGPWTADPGEPEREERIGVPPMGWGHALVTITWFCMCSRSGNTVR